MNNISELLLLVFHTKLSCYLSILGLPKNTRIFELDGKFLFSWCERCRLTDLLLIFFLLLLSQHLFIFKRIERDSTNSPVGSWIDSELKINILFTALISARILKTFDWEPLRLTDFRFLVRGLVQKAEESNTIMNTIRCIDSTQTYQT